MAEGKASDKQTEELTKLFRAMGAENPEIWARSQTERGSPELHRFVFLRIVWKFLLTFPPESREVLTEFARGLCSVLEGPPAWAWVPPELGELNWGPFTCTDDRTRPGSWLGGGLDQTFDDAKPDGHVWGTLTSVVTLRDATDATLPRTLAGLDLLKALWLGESQVTDAGLHCLASFPRLEVLDLSKTLVTDEGMPRLEKLPNLKALYLDNTQVGDAGLRVIGTLRRLDSLTLRNTRVTDSGLGALLNLESLRYVALNGCKISAEGLASLQRRFPDASVRADE
jgi:hypothetical protein